MSIVINLMIFFMIYIVPIVVFIKSGMDNRINKVIIFLICSIYLVASILTSDVTYNLFPFSIVIIDLILMGKNNYKKDFQKYKFNFNEFNIFKAFKYAIFNYLLAMIVSIVFMIILSSFKIETKDQNIVKEMSDFSLLKFIIMMPITMVFAPVVEEFVFRWVLYEKVLKKYTGVYLGAIISSVIFALFHANLKSFAVIFTIGLVNCYLINKKGYWYAVFNHFFFNSASVLVMLYYKV